MTKSTRFVGLDVHGQTIAAAIGDGYGKARSLGQFPNRPEAVRKFIEQLGGPEGLKICYEAVLGVRWVLAKPRSALRLPRRPCLPNDHVFSGGAQAPSVATRC